ncbi:MAG: hypothetical protein RO257_11745 [Candidatus Kapabacteria bacterium]|nr:hypothetical protein [Candidatus Kapabacteria bacterium]
MKVKILKFVVTINIILYVIYAFDIFLRIFGFAGIFYQNLAYYSSLYNLFYYILAFMGLELMLLSILIFNIKPKLSKNLKILLLVNLLIIVLWIALFFISE